MSHPKMPISALNLSLTEWIFIDSSFPSFLSILQLVNSWDKSTFQISLIHLPPDQREIDTCREDMWLTKRSHRAWQGEAQWLSVDL